MGIRARIVKRIITLLIVILGVVTLSFCLQIFTGTDPAEMLVRKTTLFATEEQIQAMRVELGLDGTLSEQYTDYIKGLLTGDLGISITNRKPSEFLCSGRSLPIRSCLHAAAQSAHCPE